MTHPLAAPTTDDPTADWTAVRFLEWWIDIEAPHLKPATLRNARHAVRKWSAALGPQVRLRDLRRPLLQGIIDAQLATGAAPGTVRVDYCYIATALRLAVADGAVQHDPTYRVRPPRRTTAPVDLPTEDELLRFLGACLAPKRQGPGMRFGPLVALALLTGMRRSELSGLRWHNVELDGLGDDVPMRPPAWRSPSDLALRLDAGAVGEIRVVEQLWYLSRQSFQWLPPKSDHGIRRIPLSPDLADILRAQYIRVERARLQAGTRRWREHDLVFPGPSGWPTALHTLEKARQRVAAEAGISPAPTFHILRHAFISLLVEAGVPQPTIVRLAGHADGRMIERVYYGVMERGMDDAARVIQRRAAGQAQAKGGG